MGRPIVAWKSAFARSATAAGLCAALLAACSAEKRGAGPQVVTTPPRSLADARAQTYASNVFEQSEGGRLFRWQGCGGCHSEDSPGAARLTDDQWRYGGGVPALYVSIAEGRPGGMPAYGTRIASGQIWRIAAYVHGLPKLNAPKRLRQDAALSGEPEGSKWNGPIP
jgi:cytochrome c oxidase cbb3-type subunit 3